MTDTTNSQASLTDAEILQIASQHFRPGHDPKSEPAFIACVRAIVARNAALLSEAARDVLAERQRQVQSEGWTPEHDDRATDGALSLAAATYALHGPLPVHGDIPVTWPWAPEGWKPGTPRRNLVKAGALIIAEIERIDRAATAAAPDTEVDALFEGRAENSAVISADFAVNSRTQIIARAVQAHGRAWPEQLMSGVMFYEGERITKAEFLAEVGA